MTAPVSNQNPLQVPSARTGRADSLPAATERGAKGDDTSPTASSTGSADSVTLSDAARRLSETAPPEGGPQDQDQARGLLDRLKSKMAENPGFAHAVHTANANSRLASLLEATA